MYKTFLLYLVFLSIYEIKDYFINRKRSLKDVLEPYITMFYNKNWVSLSI
jgi:hypothetical protein